MFPTTLKGAMLHYYTHLPIDSFVMLIMGFGAQYAMSKPHHLTVVMTLTNIKQKEDESVHDFTERF